MCLPNTNGTTSVTWTDVGVSTVPYVSGGAINAVYTFSCPAAAGANGLAATAMTILASVYLMA
mgnify:CR=1 FL=1